MNILRNSSLALPVGILLVLLPVLVMLFGASQSVYVLEIAHVESGAHVFRTQVDPGDHFSLEHTHSAQLSPVTDNFQIDQRYRMFLVSTVFSDHGAGLPDSSHRGETFSIQQDGRFKVSGLSMFLPEILLRVGREHNNILTCEARRVNLSERCGDALLTIRIRDYSILKRLLWGISNVG